ncbi:putative inorganic phosphate cotransporter [Penaeus japonicus]|uniref:putative inorganic phosphate cotransporter n=1 Tax=Penaeus japonicus TaxID=27405 RepID=UPI001C714930|nr:putative inorganic phosphate cotransporter [Penaeus japonicus]
MAFTGGSVLSILQRTDEETAGGQGVLVSNGGALDAKDLGDSGFRRTSGSLGEDRGLARECWAARYTFTLMAFLGLAVEYSLRVNLSIAIVAMAGTSEVNATANASQDACPVTGNGTDSGGKHVGVTYPALNSLMATWFPPEERAKFGSFVFGGMQFGTIVGLALSGWLCNSRFLGGWPSVFYVFGVAGLLWGGPWFLLICDRPEAHPRISRRELSYLQEQQDAVKGAERVTIPWRAVLTSAPMWSSAIMAFGGSFGFYALLTEMPTYLAHVQHFDIKSNGLLSGLPYVCMFTTSLACGVLMDRLLAAKCLSLKAVRRISTGIAHYAAALGLIAMCLVDCNSTVAMIVLCLSVGVTGCSYSGNGLTAQDIAPNLAGTLTGITNTLGSATGFLAPALVGAIIENDNGSLHAWRMVFLVSAGIFTVTTSLYMLLMSVDVQPWNNPENVKEENKIKVENGLAHDARES